MQLRRCADIDDVEVVHAAHLAEIGHHLRDMVFLRPVLCAIGVDIADRHRFEAVGQVPIRACVRGPNSSADDRYA